MSPETHNLRPLCTTRWTVRIGAIHAVITNYRMLCKVLDILSFSERDEYALKAGRFLQKMETFSTFLGLKFMAQLKFNAQN